MKKRTMPAISITLRPSLFILGCYAVVSMLCCLAIYHVPLPIIAKIALMMLCIMLTVYIVMRDVLLSLPWSWQTVVVTSEGMLNISGQQYEMLAPTLANSTFFHPYLTVINVKATGLSWKPAKSIVITPWQVTNKTQYRQLRVWLKWWSHEGLTN